MSPELHAVVDKEVRKLLDQGFSTALNVVKKHKAKLDKVAKKLLEVETLDGDQFAKIVGKKVVA